MDWHFGISTEVVPKSLLRRKRIDYRHTSERNYQRCYYLARQPYVTLDCLGEPVFIALLSVYYTDLSKFGLSNLDN